MVDCLQHRPYWFNILLEETEQRIYFMSVACRLGFWILFYLSWYDSESHQTLKPHVMIFVGLYEISGIGQS